MSRQCAVCGGDTQILKNEHNRVVDFRLCGGECREKWFKWNKACKAQGIQGLTASVVVYDEYVNVDMLDAGDITFLASQENHRNGKRRTSEMVNGRIRLI